MKKTAVSISLDTFPAALKPYLQNSSLYDSSCSEDAQTLYIEGAIRAFLKTSKEGSLVREMNMTRFMHKHNLAPAVIGYLCENGRDYLLTEALEGEDGIEERYLKHPERLAELFGESLRIIHNLPKSSCPYPSRSTEMLAECELNILRNYVDKSIITDKIQNAVKRLTELKHCAIDDVVIHGDYCLPNIILKDFTLRGFVDLGTGGIGDRHYDLFWGIWTLEYNLKSDKYRNIFLDAYGRDELDPERLELCRLLAGFTE
ncbi:MAG: aminoglycoside 3'-phosphotransferase [Candidatus Cloacimonas sp.]|jgi:kanamycin kinase|nr:aminoglycoside 3'-phosphotransferase [Candidatus Cloacimonas sp.]